MAGFPKKERLEIIQGYLNETGQNQFVPADFLSWLRERPSHKAYPIFFDRSDEEAAEAYRIGLVRQWVSGLRITVKPVESEGVSVASVQPVSVPAMVSPVAGRKHGGGYVSVSVNSKTSVDELADQAAGDLERWLKRYQGVASLRDVDIDPIKEIARQLRAAGVEQAA